MVGRALPFLVVLAPEQAFAQANNVDTFALGMAIGKAILIVLGVLVALSVMAKAAIVFSVVPRQPENRLQALVHGAANIVGRLRPARSLRDRRRSGRFGDRL